MKPNDFTKFRLSKPYGYHPPDVEKAIEQYEEMIGKLNDKLSEKIQLCSKYQERINKLEEELRAMHIEMSSLELPDTEEMVESVVLGDFRNYPNDPDEPLNALRGMGQQSDDAGMVTVIDDGVKICDQEDLNGANMIGMYDDEESDEEEVPKQQQPPQQQGVNQVKLGQAKPKSNLGLNLGKRQKNADDGDFFKIVT
jgi:hypothetical protein